LKEGALLFNVGQLMFDSLIEVNLRDELMPFRDLTFWKNAQI